VLLDSICRQRCSNIRSAVVGLDPRRDLFYERDHNLAALCAISTPPSGACRICDIDAFARQGRPGCRRSKGLAEQARDSAAASDRKAAPEHKLAGAHDFSEGRGSEPEAGPELWKLGTMRIMGGISARRAVHRCPVADVFWGQARHQTTKSIYQPRQRERQGLFNERI